MLLAFTTLVVSVLAGTTILTQNSYALPFYTNTEQTCQTRGGTFAALPRGNNVCVVGSGAIDSLSVSDQIESLLFYRTIGACLTSTPMTGQINSGNSNWWDGGGNVYAGAYLAGIIPGVSDNGEVSCGSLSDLNSSARDLWNIEYDDWLCAAGFLRIDVMDDSSVNNQPTLAENRCRNEDGGSGNFASYIPYSSGSTDYIIEDFTNSGDTPDNLLSVIRDRVYGGSEPEFTPAMLYSFYRQTFFNTCAAGQNWDSGGSTVAPYPKLANEFSLEIVTQSTETVEGETVVNVGTETKWFRYASGYSQDSSVINRVGPALSFSNVGRTCGQMIGYINDTGNLTAFILKLEADIDANRDAPSASDTCDRNAEECPGTTCAIPGIGWIICPIMTFLGSVADGAYTFIEGLLRTEVGIVSTDGPTYTAWQAMRNLANIGFVLVFLIIIFSQLTGGGISNYGVKKMLPRLVVAAILVNASFIISQLAVDLSNILGSSIKQVLDNLPVFSGREDGVLGALATGNSFTDVVAGWLGVNALLTGGVLVGTAAYFGGIGLLLPVLLAAVFAIVVTLGILVVRQALVVLLVIVSPLAFLAMLLPNTENLYKQWRKIFISLLILYPAVALLFGAGGLAANILSQTGAPVGPIIALAATIIPLIALPAVLKGSLNAVPVVGGIASKLASRANANVGSSAKKRYGQSRLSQFQKYRKSESDRRRSLIQSGAFETDKKDPLSRMRMASSKRNSTINSVTGAFGSGSAAAGIALAQKAEDEQEAEAKAVIDNAQLSGLERQTLAMNGSVVKNGRTYSGENMQKAAISYQMQAGSMKDQHEIVGESSGSLRKFSQSIAQGVVKNGVTSKDPALAGKRIDDISQGKFSYDGAVKSAITEGKYTAEAFAAMHDEAREKAIKIATGAAAAGDPSLLSTLGEAAKGVLASKELSGKVVGKGAEQIKGLVGNGGSSSGGLTLPGNRTPNDSDFNVPR